MQNRMSLNQYVDKAFWALLIAVVSYASIQLRNTSESIAKLNEKMAVVIIQISGQIDITKDHEYRIRKLESP